LLDKDCATELHNFVAESFGYKYFCRREFYNKISRKRNTSRKIKSVLTSFATKIFTKKKHFTKKKAFSRVLLQNPIILLRTGFAADKFSKKNT